MRKEEVGDSMPLIALGCGLDVAHVQLCTTRGLQENTGSAICGSLIAPVDFALFLGFYSYMEFVHVRVCVCLCACVCVMCVCMYVLFLVKCVCMCVCVVIMLSPHLNGFTLQSYDLQL